MRDLPAGATASLAVDRQHAALRGEQPEPGLVICYSYLWLDEFNEGREEGVKDPVRDCGGHIG